jgi:hypothetical protein
MSIKPWGAEKLPETHDMTFRAIFEGHNIPLLYLGASVSFACPNQRASPNAGFSCSLYVKPGAIVDSFFYILIDESIPSFLPAFLDASAEVSIAWTIT